MALAAAIRVTGAHQQTATNSSNNNNNNNNDERDVRRASSGSAAHRTLFVRSLEKAPRPLKAACLPRPATEAEPVGEFIAQFALARVRFSIMPPRTPRAADWRRVTL